MNPAASPLLYYVSGKIEPAAAVGRVDVEIQLRLMVGAERVQLAAEVVDEQPPVGRFAQEVDSAHVHRANCPACREFPPYSASARGHRCECERCR